MENGNTSRYPCRQQQLTLLLMFYCTIAFFCHTSCTAKTALQITHLKGILAWQQHDWDTAIAHFFSAETQAQVLQESELCGYADFALGSVYLMQHEEKAALEKFTALIQKKGSALQAQSFYQQGIISFRMQKYSEAAAFFKKTLELSGSDIDAKINYELSKNMCIRQKEAASKEVLPDNVEQLADTVEDSIILTIIKKREQAKWKKMQQEQPPSSNDY